MTEQKSKQTDTKGKNSNVVIKVNHQKKSVIVQVDSEEMEILTEPPEPGTITLEQWKAFRDKFIRGYDDPRRAEPL